MFDSGFEPMTLFEDHKPNEFWNRVYIDIPVGIFRIEIQSDFKANIPEVKAALDDILYYTLSCSEISEYLNNNHSKKLG